MVGTVGDATSNTPTEFEQPPSNLDLPHALQLSIPFPSTLQAQIVYRVISVDKPLRPKDTHIAFRIHHLDGKSPDCALEISVHTSTVRQMRLSSNAILDDITLILETMDAFSHNSDQDSLQQDKVPEQEFELNGVGRAG